MVGRCVGVAVLQDFFFLTALLHGQLSLHPLSDSGIALLFTPAAPVALCVFHHYWLRCGGRSVAPNRYSLGGN